MLAGYEDVSARKDFGVFLTRSCVFQSDLERFSVCRALILPLKYISKKREWRSRPGEVWNPAISPYKKSLRRRISFLFESFFKVFSTDQQGFTFFSHVFCEVKCHVIPTYLHNLGDSYEGRWFSSLICAVNGTLRYFSEVEPVFPLWPKKFGNWFNLHGGYSTENKHQGPELLHCPAVFGHFLDPPGNHPRGAIFSTVD